MHYMASSGCSLLEVDYSSSVVEYRVLGPDFGFDCLHSLVDYLQIDSHQS